MPSHSLPFLRGWSRDPMAVGLPFVSSTWAALRLARTTLDAAIPGGGPVLELGAGTGAVTEALLAEGCPVDQIIVVERDAELCRTLDRRFRGRLHVLQGDALELGKILRRAQVLSVSVVLSGLPMRAIPRVAAARCYAAALRLMPRGGAVIQYTYGLKSPVDCAALKLDGRFIGREWRNVPPIGIWRYRRRSVPGCWGWEPGTKLPTTGPQEPAREDVR